MSRKWTEEQKRAQGERIREWQPWKKGGVKTEQGKAKSRLNALKSGAHTEEMKQIRRIFRECRNHLRALESRRKE